MYLVFFDSDAYFSKSQASEVKKNFDKNFQ